ncbi:ribosomal large subunit pseudouridine synthase D [Vibrio maritimus]|uniref:Ribosomal large subunit pseudouridine synthase D n=2 Tax=Vibrio TaxID=662 RepID=A0A090S437_9VIBR|nr:ribosomal large subunit pseudouridine synthase D [Vibrio maritimus]GAL24128.1 ribosomal large subunit pseudouridine synthase D [Vibrio variabilis]
MVLVPRFFKKFDMAQQIELTNTVKDSQLGQRLDQAVAELFADFLVRA